MSQRAPIGVLEVSQEESNAEHSQVRTLLAVGPEGVKGVREIVEGEYELCYVERDLMMRVEEGKIVSVGKG